MEMNKNEFSAKSKPWFSMPWCKHQEKSIDTLTSFVQDIEHEVMSVLTVLQAQIDLLHEEQLKNDRPVDRFPGMNRSVSRLISDTYALASIAELAKLPRCKDKVDLGKLINEVVAETQLDFSRAQVTVSCAIPNNTVFTGNASSLKQMIKGLLIVSLQKCQAFDTVTVTAWTNKNSVVLSCDSRKGDMNSVFQPWRVGHLQSVPTNGDGIRLSAIDAMARMHHGELNICRTPDLQDAYKLVFES